MRKFVFLIVSVLVASVGCSGRKQLKLDDNKVSKAGIVALSASSIKQKKNKFDLDFSITNESDRPIIILLREMECFKGAERGGLKHTFFNTGERTIDFRGGETKKLRFVCTLAGPAEGDPRVVVKKVYSNPSGDGATIGAVLVENIEWTLMTAK